MPHRSTDNIEFLFVLIRNGQIDRETNTVTKNHKKREKASYTIKKDRHSIYVLIKEGKEKTGNKKQEKRRMKGKKRIH